MPFVIDASVAAAWLLPDEEDPVATTAYDRLLHDHAIVPGLWWLEMRNIFISNERRGRLDSEKTRLALALLTELPIQLDHAADSGTLLELARRHRLTAYDAAYLELARRLALPLASLDHELCRAATTAGVDLLAA